MKTKLINLMLLVIVSVAAFAFSDSYWASGVIGDWDDPATWGVSEGYPEAGDDAHLNLGSTVTINGTAEACKEVEVGSWSGTPDLVTLNIINGGSLENADWTWIGVTTGDVGEVNVGPGSTLTSFGPLNVGYDGAGTMNVNGGTVNATGKKNEGGLFVSNPWATAGTGSGTLNLLDGIINVGTPDTYTDFAMSDTGLIDICAGTLKIYGLWWDDALNTYIGNNQIIGWAGSATVDISYDGDYTVLTSTHPYQPNPAVGAVVSAGPYTMTWVLPEPNYVGGTVSCDVYLVANEPNFLSAPKIVDNQVVESASVSLLYDTTYYWRIDIYDTTSDVNPVEGPVFYFDVGNAAPVVDAGDDVYTWLTSGIANVNLSGTIVEDDENPVPATVSWEVTAEPSVGAATITTPADQLDITVELTELGDYDLTLTADDTEFTGSDTVTIHVYSDSCEAAKGAGIPTLDGDFDLNCIVDIDDFAVFAENWLNSIAL
jgi:T5SS/PEP-CTERM-associated repeat protein